MQAKTVDFTLFFRRLGQAASDGEAHGDVRGLFIDPTQYDEWSKAWLERLRREPQPGEERQAAMDTVNPAVIARNHRVEAALAAADQDGELEPLESLLAALANPYVRPTGALHLMEPPESGDAGYRTFCGT